MAKAKRLVLSTRALTTNMVAGAKSKKVSVDVVSFIQTKIIDTEESRQLIREYAKQKITAIFTSVHALRAITGRMKRSPDWDVYCTSGTTHYEAVSYFGVDNVRDTAKNAAFLANKIGKRTGLKNVVFFCGDKRMDTIKDTLGDKGIPVEEVIMYNTTLTPKVIEKKYDAILFFSPSAAESFFAVNKIPEETVLLSIGETTAEAIKLYSENKVLVCKQPSEDALLSMIIKGK